MDEENIYWAQRRLLACVLLAAIEDLRRGWPGAREFLAGELAAHYCRLLEIAPERRFVVLDRERSFSPVVPDGYVDTDEGGRISGYDPKYVRYMAAAGVIRAERIGRRWLVNVEDLEDHVVDHRLAKNGRRPAKRSDGRRKRQWSPPADGPDLEMVELMADYNGASPVEAWGL